MAMSAKASDDIAWLPATAQLAVLAAKKVSSAELVELYLSRIDTYNASLNAIVTVDPDAARRVAKRSDAARARGDELGPLHGLPITVKDSYETAGMRTTCGRRDLADYVPTQDAEAVARLRRAGAIIMGKTNMPTGNQDVQASNPVFGRTNNPWDAARTSGGSAGGGAGPPPPRGGPRGGGDQQRHHEECPDDLDSLGGYHAHQCGEHNSQGAHWHAAGGRDLRIDGGKQERSVADRQHGDHEQTNHGQHGQPGVTDPDDLAGQQRKTGPGRFRWARSRSTR